jgi:hypothetical protein
MTEPDYLPTQEEIKEACNKIQEGWDDYTRMKRQYGITQDTVSELDWTPPVIAYGYVRDLLNIEDDLNSDFNK